MGRARSLAPPILKDVIARNELGARTVHNQWSIVTRVR
jgi:hypothetical protein